MADRQFDIEVLIKARNAASQELQKVAGQVKGLENQIEGLKKANQEATKTIDGLTKQLSKLGQAGTSSAQAQDKAYKDLGKTVRELDKELFDAQRSAERLGKSAVKSANETQSNMEDAKESVHGLYLELERTAKRMANTKLTPFQRDQVEKDWKDTLTKLTELGEKNALDYGLARLNVELDTNRKIISERAKLESEVGKAVSSANRGAQQALNESLAKIAEVRRSLIDLGDSNVAKTIKESFELAIGKRGTGGLSELSKTIQSVGIATKKEIAELEQAGRKARLTELNGIAEQAIAVRDLTKLKKVGIEVEIERQRAAIEAEEAEKRNIKELENLNKDLTQAERTRSLEAIKSFRAQQKFAHDYERQLERLAQKTVVLSRSAEEISANENTFSRFADSLLGLEQGGRRADASLRDLALSARGFVYAFAIKYAQALTSALVGLGGEAIAVAASMVSAGAAIGGAFTAGVLQAIPAVGLLIATLTRASKIFEVLNLKQTIQEGGNRREQQSGDEAARELDRITNAQEGLADAQRDLVRAQEELTQARGEARRELQDLIRAERDARLAARGAALSQEDAQRNLRAALAGGDVFAIRSAELDVDQAGEGVNESRLRASRAAADAQRGRRGGIEGTDRVINARRQLADAERRVAQATRSVAAAQRASAVSTAENNAQQERLKFLLDQLSPAERQLFRALESLQETYKKAFRPITDIIVRSFTDGIVKIEGLIQDKSVLKSLRGLAGVIGDSIRSVTDFATGGRSRSFIEFFIGESAKNLPQITESFIKFAEVIMRIGEAATPVFDYLVDLVDDIAEGLLNLTDNQGGLLDFFEEATQDLDGLVELVKSLGRIFAAIFDPARDAGRKSIKRITDNLNDLADTLKKNEEGVRQFFEDSTRITVAIFGVIKALVIEIAKIFNPESVEEFADVLTHIFIPALGQAVRLMGLVTHAVQTFLNIPLVSDVARFAFTIFLFTKALDILRRSLAGIALVFAGLFGTASRGAGAFNIITRTLVILGSALATLGFEIKGVGSIVDSTVGKISIALLGAAGFIGILNKAAQASKVFRGTVAVQTAGALTGVTRFTRGAAARMAGLRAIFATNPFGLLITGITLALTAFGLFRSSTEETKSATESLTDALLAQREAYRALRDGALDTRDAQLAVRSSEIRLERAIIDRRKLIREIDKDDKRTVQERRALREANINVEQSEIDLTRARRRSRDAREDEISNLKKFQEESKKTLDQAREKVKAIKTEKEESNERIDQLKELISDETTLVKQGIGNRERLKGFQERLNKEEDKNVGITKRLKNANKELNDALKTAGRGFFRLGKNADAFGLTFSDVLQFLERGANKALGAFGAKKVDIALEYIKDSSYFISDFPEKRAQGGLIDGSGLMDTVPIMAAPGEGILNRHQMPIVDTALRASGIMQGGLGELWSRIQTPHYMARGGFVQGAESRGLTPATLNFANRMFELGYNVTSAFRAGDPRQHGRGEALDFGNSVNNLGQLWRIVFPLRRQFNQLLGPPGLYNGLRKFIDPGLQSDHNDHIHIGFRNAVSGVLGTLNETISRVRIKGGPAGYMTTILRAAERRIRNAGQTMVDRKASQFGDDPHNIDFKKVAKGSLTVGQVRGIAAQSLRLLGIKEQKADWIKMLVARAYQESTFNPNAVNNWDSNAQRGTPSRGLMQTIDSTFRRYALPRFSQILNPLHNMIAAIRYMIAQYGKGDQRVALRAMFNRNAAKIGYNTGGPIGRYVPNNPRVSAASLGNNPFDNPIFRPIINDLNKAYKKIKDGKFIKGLSDLTADNGAIARFFQALSETGEKIANRIARGNIRVRRNGEIIVKREGNQVTRAEIRGLRRTQDTLLEGREELGDTRRAAESAVDKAEREVRKARKEGDKKATKKAKDRLAKARAGLRGVKQTQTELENLITANANDILAKEQELRDAIIAQQLEATETLVSNADRKAGFALNKADRTSRVGNIVSATTAGGALAGLSFQRASLVARGSALNQQRNDLDAARNRALSLGQTEIAEDLADRLEELNVSVLENNLALSQNTDAQRDTNVQNILSRNGFLTGINNAAVNFFQGLSSLTGTNNNSIITSLLTSSNSTLASTRGGLLGELNIILNQLGQGPISGSGSDLVNALVGASSLDTSGLSPEAKSRFETLIQAIIDNETAINANTETINGLTNTVGQAFSSSSWQLFREAVFDGAGGLIPEFQSKVPQMYEGGLVQRNGLFYLHAGEKVSPKHQVTPNKENHNWYVTSPTEIADPDHFATVFSFRRSTQRAN